MTTTTPPIISGQKAKPDPEAELKSVAQTMFLYAFWLALQMAGVLVWSSSAADAIGMALFVILAVLISLYVLAGLLLLRRRRAGVVLTWVLFPLMVIAAPVGTLAGVYVAAKLKKPEVRALIL